MGDLALRPEGWKRRFSPLCRVPVHRLSASYLPLIICLLITRAASASASAILEHCTPPRRSVQLLRRREVLRRTLESPFCWAVAPGGARTLCRDREKVFEKAFAAAEIGGKGGTAVVVSIEATAIAAVSPPFLEWDERHFQRRLQHRLFVLDSELMEAAQEVPLLPQASTPHQRLESAADCFPLSVPDALQAGAQGAQQILPKPQDLVLQRKQWAGEEQQQQQSQEVQSRQHLPNPSLLLQTAQYASEVSVQQSPLHQNMQHQNMQHQNVQQQNVQQQNVQQQLLEPYAVQSLVLPQPHQPLSPLELDLQLGKPNKPQGLVSLPQISKEQPHASLQQPVLTASLQQHQLFEQRALQHSCAVQRQPLQQSRIQPFPHAASQLDPLRLASVAPAATSIEPQSSRSLPLRHTVPLLPSQQPYPQRELGSQQGKQHLLKTHPLAHAAACKVTAKKGPSGVESGSSEESSRNEGGISRASSLSSQTVSLQSSTPLAVQPQPLQSKKKFFPAVAAGEAGANKVRQQGATASSKYGSGSPQLPAAAQSFRLQARYPKQQHLQHLQRVQKALPPVARAKSCVEEGLPLAYGLPKRASVDPASSDSGSSHNAIGSSTSAGCCSSSGTVQGCVRSSQLPRSAHREMAALRISARILRRSGRNDASFKDAREGGGAAAAASGAAVATRSILAAVDDSSTLRQLTALGGDAERECIRWSHGEQPPHPSIQTAVSLSKAAATVALKASSASVLPPLGTSLPPELLADVQQRDLPPLSTGLAAAEVTEQLKVLQRAALSKTVIFPGLRLADSKAGTCTPQEDAQQQKEQQQEQHQQLQQEQHQQLQQEHHQQLQQEQHQQLQQEQHQQLQQEHHQQLQQEQHQQQQEQLQQEQHQQQQEHPKEHQQKQHQRGQCSPLGHGSCAEPVAATASRAQEEGFSVVHAAAASSGGVCTPLAAAVSSSSSHNTSKASRCAPVTFTQRSMMRGFQEGSEASEKTAKERRSSADFAGSSSSGGGGGGVWGMRHRLPLLHHVDQCMSSKGGMSKRQRVFLSESMGCVEEEKRKAGGAGIAPLTRLPLWQQETPYAETPRKLNLTSFVGETWTNRSKGKFIIVGEEERGKSGEMVSTGETQPSSASLDALGESEVFLPEPLRSLSSLGPQKQRRCNGEEGFLGSSHSLDDLGRFASQGSSGTTASCGWGTAGDTEGDPDSCRRDAFRLRSLALARELLRRVRSEMQLVPQRGKAIRSLLEAPVGCAPPPTGGLPVTSHSETALLHLSAEQKASSSSLPSPDVPTEQHQEQQQKHKQEQQQKHKQEQQQKHKQEQKEAGDNDECAASADAAAAPSRVLSENKKMAMSENASGRGGGGSTHAFSSSSEQQPLLLDGSGSSGRGGTGGGIGGDPSSEDSRGDCDKQSTPADGLVVLSGADIAWDIATTLKPYVPCVTISDIGLVAEDMGLTGSEQHLMQQRVLDTVKRQHPNVYPITLSKDARRECYSEQILNTLFHCRTPPVGTGFSHLDWQGYVRMNEEFAKAVEQVYSEGDVILVQSSRCNRPLLPHSTDR
ncbi:trehalose-6-phosphate synthase subunit 1 related protein [Cyclospora cayetanensis]|uniref:Trehalose-6-phosphate synthase subunit 1 related protein n=1 Tax=Cyclospora cayetanensis TaxID=88456 RepID=A0A1D3CZ93_9EIME|nr:trehalose-6-phosphate synthase subunit 1 related protein [Cyclospora cayetanensis]